MTSFTNIFDQIKKTIDEKLPEFLEDFNKPTAEPVPVAAQTSFSIWPVKVPINGEYVQKAINLAILGNDTIKSLDIDFQKDSFSIEMLAKHMLVSAHLKAQFAIDAFEISSKRQMVILRRLGDIQADAEGWMDKVVLYVVKGFLSAILGKSLLEMSLENLNAVEINGDLITVNLAQFNIREMIKDAADSYLSPALGSIVIPMIDTKLGSVIAITGVECNEYGLTATINSAES